MNTGIDSILILKKWHWLTSPDYESANILLSGVETGRIIAKVGIWDLVNMQLLTGTTTQTI